MSTQIKSWLEEFGLGRYADTFFHHHVDFDVLADLTNQDLQDLGVSLGDRKRLLKAISALPPAVTKKAGETPSGEARRPAGAAERRQLTVMFCDLIGSTALSVRFDPEDLSEIIAAFQQVCKAVLDRYGGYIARYMGDGILVYFGYPQASELDPERAVRAALEITQAVPQLEVRPGVVLHVRVGIATGEVVVGELIGEGPSRERTVLGETPNLAARLQSMAGQNRVVVSDTTRGLVGGLFEFADLGLHAVQGFDEEVQAWGVGDELVVESRFEAMHQGLELTPLVGREKELAMLVERWEQARSGHGQSVLLRAEAGIGKSRLTQALRETLALEPHLLLRYFCVPYHNNSVLFPVIGQLERAAQFDRNDSSGSKLDKLEALLALSVNDVSSVAPLFANLLSIPSSSRYSPLSLSPQRQKERTLAALEEQLIALAVKQPVLIIFEDLHWVDATTLELLTQVVRRARAQPVLLLMTARPDFETPWATDDDTTIELTRLERSHGAELVAGVTAGKALPVEVLELIVDKTDGVPLFIEELTKTVLRSGLLDEKNGRYELTRPLPDLIVPSTLQGSLMARLDRFGLAKQVAEIGAAIGRQFSFELLCGVASMTTQTLEMALDQLTAMELVQCQGSPPAAIYTFRHALIQDAAYSSLLRTARKTLHARIAVEIEQRFPETATTEPELLAHHYTRADDKPRAIAYWHGAGNKANARAAHAEALKHLATGLELLRELPEGVKRDELELGLQVSVGLSLASTQGYATSAVQATYERADELCRTLGDTVETFPVTRNICTFYIVRDELTHARELAQHCVGIARQTRNPSYLVEAYTALGYVECHRGDYQGGCSLLEKCLDVYRRHRREIVPLTPQDPGVACGSLRAVVLWFLGRTGEAREQIDSALGLATELNHPFHLAYVHTYCAMLAELDGEADLAQEHSMETIRLSQENGFEVWNAVGTIHLGYAKALLGEAEEAIAILEKVLGLYEATGARSVMPYFLTGLVEGYRGAGKLQAALSTVDKALAHAERFDHHMYDSLLHRLRGQVLLAMPACNHETVRKTFEKSIDVARKNRTRQLELEAVLALHELNLSLGEAGTSRDMLAEACSYFDGAVRTRALAESRRLLAQAGDP